MSEFFCIFGLIVAGISVLLCAGIATMNLLSWYQDYRYKKSYNYYINHLRCHLASWSQWLSNDFPVTGEVLDTLLKDSVGGSYRDISTYRDQLRKKYQKETH